MDENKMLIKLCVTPSVVFEELLNDIILLLDIEKIFVRQYTLITEQIENSFLCTSLTKYSQSMLSRTLKQIKDKNFFLELVGADYVSVVRLENYCIFSLLISEQKYFASEKYFTDMIEKNIQKSLCDIAYIAPYQEYLSKHKNITTANIYRHIQHQKYNSEKISVSALKKVFFEDDIWKPIYWKMWFHNTHFSVILDNCAVLKDFIQISIEDTSYAKIELYKNPNSYSTKETLRAKKLFSQYIYNDIPKGIVNVEIKYDKNQLRIIHYLNDSGEFVSKSCATHLEIFEYLLTGNREAQLISHQDIIK